MSGYDGAPVSGLFRDRSRKHRWARLLLILLFFCAGAFIAFRAMQDSSRRLTGGGAESGYARRALYDDLASLENKGFSLRENAESGVPRDEFAESDSIVSGGGAGASAAGPSRSGAAARSSSGRIPFERGPDVAPKRFDGQPFANAPVYSRSSPGMAGPQTGGGDEIRSAAGDGAVSGGEKASAAAEAVAGGGPKTRAAARLSGKPGALDLLKYAAGLSLHAGKNESVDSARALAAQSFDLGENYASALHYRGGLARLDKFADGATPGILRDNGFSLARAGGLAVPAVDDPAVPPPDFGGGARGAGRKAADGLINPLFGGLPGLFSFDMQHTSAAPQTRTGAPAYDGQEASGSGESDSGGRF
ncbi:MAG: hypothetical protein PHP45_03740 [Elusimicrobiales bacterium]|nr:hypothetical protein [Elusimicrobiales bacterium]